MAEPENDNSITSRWKLYKASFLYDGGPEKAGEVRNCLLVVAALVAAVTFQAAMNPPGGVWQDTNSSEKGHVPGKSVYATWGHDKGRFNMFVIFNTFAFSSSIFIIHFLTSKFPFRMEVRIAIFGMFVGYVVALDAVAPNSESLKFRISLTVSMLSPMVLRAIRFFCRI